MTEAAMNTDREIWRAREGDAYADSIHVTKEGAIGIDCGGYVIVKPVHEWHALASTAPSPDGDEVERVAAAIWGIDFDQHFPPTVDAFQAWEKRCFGKVGGSIYGQYATAAISAMRPAPNEDRHSDDVAVDNFAVALKAKLAKKRSEGRGGWDDPEQCSAAFLSKLMREHVEKGDPLDVGAFAMMLQQRGEPIQAAPLRPTLSEEDRARMKTVAEELLSLIDKLAG